jgi:hypothetical protein
MRDDGIFWVIWNFFTAVWSILGPIGNIVVIWYIFSRFGQLCQEKSGKNSNAGKFCRALEYELMVYIGIFYTRLVYFRANWQCSGNMVYFSLFWYIVSRKIWHSCTTF